MDTNSSRSCRPGLASILLTGALLVGATSCGAGSPASQHPHGDNGLVGYPSFLPRSTLHDHGDTTLTATTSRPALTSEGDPVRVVTPQWSVIAVVDGPEVPGEGLPYQTPATICTWTVTLSGATGPVPVAVSDFDSIDARGAVYHPYLVAGPPSPPTVLEPGQDVTFELRAGEAVGEGLMRWAPVGGDVVAKWDFVVEND